MSEDHLQNIGWFVLHRSSLTNFYCFNIHDLYLDQGGEFRGNSQLFRKTVISFQFHLSAKIRSRQQADKIFCEYSNKRVLVMSKVSLQNLGQLEFPKSSLTIFYCFNIHGLYLGKMVEFRGNSQLVGKTMVSFQFHLSVKVRSRSQDEKIFNEYSNKRIQLMSKGNLQNMGQLEFPKSSLTIFYCFNINGLISRSKRGISGREIVCRKDQNQLSIVLKCQSQISLVGRENLL